MRGQCRVANGSVIHNPNVIYPGEVLNVPYGPPAGTTTSTAAGSAVLTISAALSGTLGCPGLEELWKEAGGSEAQAVTAASIAMAESSGQQHATGAASERGYWQINPDHGSLSTYDPLGGKARWQLELLPMRCWPVATGVHPAGRALVGASR